MDYLSAGYINDSRYMMNEIISKTTVPSSELTTNCLRSGVFPRRSGGGEHQTEKRQPFSLFGLYVTPFPTVVPK